MVIGAVSLNTNFAVQRDRKRRQPISVLAAIDQTQGRLDREVIAPLKRVIGILLRDVPSE